MICASAMSFKVLDQLANLTPVWKCVEAELPFVPCFKRTLTLSLPRSSIDDLVFSVFTSNFVKLSYKISLLKNRFVTLFFIRFS